MVSVGKFLNHFRRLNLQGFQIGGDEGYGHQLMDRIAEEGFHLKRFNNGAQARQPNVWKDYAASLEKILLDLKSEFDADLRRTYLSGFSSHCGCGTEWTLN